MIPWVYRTLGLLLLLVPFIPLSLLFPINPGSSAAVPGSEWLLGLSIVGSLAWLSALVLKRNELQTTRLSKLGRSASTSRPAFFLLPLAFLLLAASWQVFQHRPLLVDEIAQVFQAQIFARGSLVAPLPPEAGFFALQHLVEGTNGWYAQYPAGHSALLALGMLAGAPWIVPILLSLGSAWLLFLFTDRIYDRRTAILTLALLVLAPFFWFMGASFMNHVSALFFTCLALYLFAVWEKEGPALALVGAAAALGAVFVIRPVDAIAVGAVLATWAAWRCIATGRWLRLVAAAMAGAAVASLYLAWNFATTGDPFVPGYIELWGSAHGLGFHESPVGEPHTPWTGLRNQLTDLALLNLFLFEWPLPALLPVGFYFILGWDRSAWDRLLLAAAVAVPAAYFFYWHRDAYLGPRFLYVTIAFFVPLTARAILSALERLRSREWGSGGLKVRASTLVLSAVVLSFGYSILYGTPQRFRVYATGMQSLKVDLAAQARTVGIEEGIVFVAVSWGNRLISGLRAAGVPASDVEKAYRRVDHCDLHKLLLQARGDGWTPDRVQEETRRLVVRTGTRDLIATAELNGDPTLRLRTDRALAPECREEVLYDRAGLTNFEPHLLVNRPTLDGPLIVARDLREENAALRSLYPDRPAFLWRGGEFEPLP